MWDMLFVSRQLISHHIRESTAQMVASALSQRGKVERDQGKDNLIFAPLSTATHYALRTGDYQLAISLFEDCYPLAIRYEQDSGCEIHKGAIAFDVAHCLPSH